MGPAGVAIRLLGGFEIVIDGVPTRLNWPGRRPAELVQLLAIAPGHRLFRDQVIDRLWPNLGIDAGAANLRKSAHLARRVLGDDSAVVLRQQQVLLFPDSEVTSDLLAFQQLADDALTAADAIGAAQAIAAYHGPLLPDARYQEWAADARDAVERRYRAVLTLAERWDLLADLDPTDEEACRQVMQSALAAGQRGRAVAAYHRLRRALQDELSLQPDRSTEALFRLCRSDPLASGNSPAGRDDRVETFRQLLHDVESAELVLVRGDDRHACAQVCADQADAAGWITVRVIATGAVDAYATITLLVRGLVQSAPGRMTELDPMSRGALRTMLPPHGQPHAQSGDLKRHQVLRMVQHLIARVGAGHGVVLMVEDAEQMDSTSLEVLALLRDGPVGRVIVVLTHPDPPDRRLHSALRHMARRRPPVILAPSPSAQIAPPPSPPPEALAPALRDLLCRLAVVGDRLDLDLLRALGSDDTDELLDQAIDEGHLGSAGDCYRFRDEALRTRLAGLIAPHQRSAVHREVAQRLADMNARPGRIALHWTSGERPDEAAKWHVRAAEEAMRLGGFTEMVEQAEAALRLKPRDPGALQLRAAGLDALGDMRALSAYSEAIAVANPQQAHELRPAQALAQIELGDLAGGLRTLAGAEPQTLGARLAQAVSWSAAALFGLTSPEMGTRLAEEVRAQALRAGNPGAVVVASLAQSIAAHARGELQESLLIDLADTSTLPAVAASVFDGYLCVTQQLLYGGRPYAQVIEFSERFAREADRLGAARGKAFAVTLRGEAKLLSGQLTEAAADLQEGVRLHRRLSAATGESLGCQRLAELAYLGGDVVEARRWLDRALDVARGTDAGLHLFDRIYGTRVQLAQSVEAAYEAVLDAEEAVRGPFETCLSCRIAFEVPAAIAVAQAGDLERLERYENQCTYLAEVIMRLPAWSAALREVRGHALLARGDLADGQRELNAAMTGFDGVGQPLNAARCRTALARIP